MTLVEQLRSELTAAMRRRDKPVVAAVRGTLGDLANAEAVSVPDTPSTVTSEHVAGTSVGLAATEAPRRQLGIEEQRVIVVRHRAELLDHAERLTRLCRLDEAAGARRSADLLGAVLDRTV